VEIMDKFIFVVYKKYQDGTERTFNVFDDEDSAIKSVRGIHARYKTHYSKVEAYYKKYKK